MSEKEEDKPLSSIPNTQPVKLDVEKLLKQARRVPVNQDGVIQLDKTNPQDQQWYGEEE